MSALRWSIPAVLLVAVAAGVGWFASSGTDDSLGTESKLAATHFLEGSAHLRRMEFEAARSDLLAAVDADPRFAMAHLELGYAMTWLNERTSGRDRILLADSLAHAPGHTTDLERLVIGMTAAQIAEDYPRHADYYEQLVRDHAGHPLTLRAQAQRALDDGETDQARELYLAVLEADPERVDIHNTLGYMALHAGHYDEAMAAFQRYAYYAADSANPHDSLGEVYLWTGRYHESIEAYRTALEMDPSFLSSVVGATDALAVTGQFRLARKFLESFEGLFDRRNQWATREVKYLQIDYLAEEWTEVAQRVERLRSGGRIGDIDVGLQLWVNTLGALSLTELGREEEAAALATEAEASFQSLLDRLDPENIEVRADLQMLRASLRTRMALLNGLAATQELAALRGLIEASAHPPHRLLPYQGVLIESLYDAGLDREAQQVASDILSFNPHHPRTLLVSARVAARQRNRAAALDYLQRYLEVMRDADENHRRVSLAQQLHERLAPSS